MFLSYDCETATVPDEEGTEVAAEGDTYLLRYIGNGSCLVCFLNFFRGGRQQFSFFLKHSLFDNFFFSVCMTKTGEARECGEFWFLVPPANSSLDKRDKDHRVLLLVDKEEYDTNSEVIVYVPTSHVLLHQVVIMIVNYVL